jgi:TM2 domain-containing membrane protein YozV
MSNTLKGILFSALIFPGAGQIILGRYRRGAVFFAVAFISGILCVTAVVRQAVVMLQEVVAEGGVVNIPKVMAVLGDASTFASSTMMKGTFFILFCCWLFSVVDAWRIGKELDRKPADI